VSIGVHRFDLANNISHSPSNSQKSEDNLAAAESEIDKQTGIITDLNKRIDELQEQADEAVKLKDRVDECVL
jgi:protein HOOK3